MAALRDFHVIVGEPSADKARTTPCAAPQDRIGARADDMGHAPDLDRSALFKLAHDVGRRLHRQCPPAHNPILQDPRGATSLIGMGRAPDLCRQRSLCRNNRYLVPMVSKDRLIPIEPRQSLCITGHDDPVSGCPCIIDQHGPVAVGRPVTARARERCVNAIKRPPRHAFKQRIVS